MNFFNASSSPSNSINSINVRYPTPVEYTDLDLTPSPVFPSLGSEKMDLLVRSFFQGSQKKAESDSCENIDFAVPKMFEEAEKLPNKLGDDLHLIARIFKSYHHRPLRVFPEDSRGYLVHAWDEIQESRNELGLLVYKCIYPEMYSIMNSSFRKNFQASFRERK